MTVMVLGWNFLFIDKGVKKDGGWGVLTKDGVCGVLRHFLFVTLS